MEKDQLISKLKKEMNEMYSNGQDLSEPTLSEKGEHIVETMEVIAPNEGQSSTVIDANCGYVFSHNSIHQNLFEIQPVSTNDYIQSGAWIEQTHPKSLESILRIVTAVYRFLHILPSNRVKDFNFIYQHTLLSKNNTYVCLILHFYVLTVNAAKKPELIMLRTKLNPLPPLKDDYVNRHISIEPYKLFKKSKLLDPKEYVALTATEREVIELVNTGMDYIEIAKIRYRSIKTILTHFRNINLKLGMHSIKQSCLCAYFYFLHQKGERLN